MQKANNINTDMHKIHGLNLVTESIIAMKLIYVYNIYIIDHYNISTIFIAEIIVYSITCMISYETKLIV